MAKKIVKRGKHMPQRTCVGCRETLAKRGMIRIVRTPEGLRVDPTGKLPGRGAYLHDRRSCWERGLRGALAHALKVELTDPDREMLQGFMATLPPEAPLPEEVAEESANVNPAEASANEEGVQNPTGMPEMGREA